MFVWSAWSIRSWPNWPHRTRSGNSFEILGILPEVASHNAAGEVAVEQLGWDDWLGMQRKDRVELRQAMDAQAREELVALMSVAILEVYEGRKRDDDERVES